MSASTARSFSVRDFRSFEIISTGYKKFALSIAGDFSKPTYQIYSVDAFYEILKKAEGIDLNNAIVLNVVHWGNILQRAHFTCTAGLLRNLRWLDVVTASSRNYFGVSAGLRGFIEAASDTFDALALAPEILADAKNYFDIFVNGGQLDYFLSPELLEDKLLHFVFACRPNKKEATDPINKAKQSSEYIKGMEQHGAPGLYSLHQELCEVVHPAAKSISHFETERPNGFAIKLKSDAEEIDALVLKHQAVFFPLFELAFNPIFLSLAVLNKYPLKELHTSEAVDRYVAPMAKWKRIEYLLKNGPENIAIQRE
jgi:hypothetical protein